MAIRSPKELFVLLLSHARQRAERSTTVYEELGEAAQHPEIKEVLEARAFIAHQTLEKLDQVFKLTGEKPVNTTDRIQEIFVEDFRREISEIQSPEARRLYALAKIEHLVHLRIAEYVALIAASDATGNYAAGVLLESCLADHVAFAERTRRLLHHIAEGRLAARAAAG